MRLQNSSRVWGLLLTIAVIALIAGIPWGFKQKEPASAADYAAWFQAVASVVATLAVLWIARQDHRARLAENAAQIELDLASAEVTAIVISPGLSHAAYALGRARERMRYVEANAHQQQISGSVFENFAFVHRHLSTLRLPNEEQLVRLLAIPGAAPIAIARYVGETANAKDLADMSLEHVAPNAGPPTTEQISGTAKIQADAIERAEALLKVGRIGLSEFTEKRRGSR